MSTLQKIENFLNTWADLMWSTPLVVLLVGGGLFFMIYSRLRPYRYFGHALDLLRGKYSDAQDPGHIPHSHALSTALSAVPTFAHLLYSARCTNSCYIHVQTF